MEAVQQLANFINPPDIVRSPVSSSLFDGFGPSIELPEDYISFLNIFGAGCLTSDRYKLFTFDLTAAPDQRAEVVWESSCDGREYQIQERCYGAYPETPGVLPWGCDDQGLTFFWLVDGLPSSWRTIVGRTEYNLYEMGMTQLMLDCVANRIPFYDDVIGDNIRYIPS